MASTPSPRASAADRDRAAPVSRRQLLTTRGSQDAPPRVVLHLPDLDALSAVAIGPPRPAAHRRIDQAHTVVAERHDEPAGADASGSKVNSLKSVVKKQLIDLAKAPVGQLVEQVAPNGKLSIPRLIVLLQSPKMVLAAVMAIGLQFAALLAMFTGGGAPDPNAAGGSPGAVAGAPDVSIPSVSLPPGSPLAPPGPLPGPFTVGGPGPIHTPLSTPNTFSPSLPGAGSPTVVAQPTLPPPQSLPGLKPGDVPPWSEEKLAAPSLAAPTSSAVPGVSSANAPGSLVPPSAPSPTLPNIGPTIRTTPVVQSNDGVGSKPRARLQGTIKPASQSETKP